VSDNDKGHFTGTYRKSRKEKPTQNIYYPSDNVIQFSLTLLFSKKSVKERVLMRFHIQRFYRKFGSGPLFLGHPVYRRWYCKWPWRRWRWRHTHIISMV